LLSFYLFVIIGIGIVVVSLLDKSPHTAILNMEKIEEKPARILLILWGLLILTMIGLYIFFIGH
ncbi:Na+/glucose cotransporter, partial [Bacteroides thetaiotaomicron]|nr:Na+/glucose cotransporter [Bacteroides thetaiotaomicron]